MITKNYINTTLEDSDKMVIVSLLNVSNREDLWADSGYITQVLLGKEFTRAGHCFVMVGPFQQQLPFRHHFLEFGDTKYAVRFGFDYSSIRKIIKNIYREHKKIDWIWVNQPEITTSVRAILAELELHAVRILTYIHYLPVLEYSEKGIAWDPSLDDAHLATTIMRRVAEGCNVSDVVGIHAGFGKKERDKPS